MTKVFTAAQPQIKSYDTAAQPQVKSYDPIWEQVRREAEDTSANEPVLASVIYATILSEPTLEDAVCHTVAHRQIGRAHV